MFKIKIVREPKRVGSDIQTYEGTADEEEN
jgi:hypothetical protein